MGNQPSSSSSSGGQRSGPQSPSSHRNNSQSRNQNQSQDSGSSSSRSHSHSQSHGSANIASYSGPNAALHQQNQLQPPRDPNPRGGRRESIHTLSSVKATAAPPSASLESARSQTAAPQAHSSTLLRAAHDNSRNSLVFPTTPVSLAPVHPAHHTISDDGGVVGATSTMGAEQSRQRHERHHHKAKSAPSPQSRPVDVPTAHSAHNPQYQPSHAHPEPHSQSSTAMTAGTAVLDDANATPDYFMPPPPQSFARPPRLPLPIEAEVHTPGSPIISPADLAPVDTVEGSDGELGRRTSVLSSTTADDEELVDEFQGPQNVPTVPTIIEWEEGGEKVYVTGTFVEWNRKFRLHPNGPSKKKDVLSTTVNITPGTHHLKFIVDGDMRTSSKLPTAVDFTNILVNYLEVSADDVPQPMVGAKDETQPPQPAPVRELRVPPGIYPPQTLPPTPDLLPVQQPAPEAAPPAATVPAVTGKYHSVIPRYLRDLDAPEDSPRFARASAATVTSESLPAPPTLPLFLNKSILNGVTPMKDDSSVLIMPNHTVLNHLATSSIRDDILATSATTRYKQKFLTTIMYKPKEASTHD